MEILLATLEDTSRFAKRLARCITQLASFPAILMQGDLGSGKTTLTRMLVSRLPGGDQAEISSPSFTVMNMYPTRPETVHFDFYRIRGLGLDGAMEESLHDTQKIRIAEWIEYLPEHLWPDTYLLITWTTQKAIRKLTLGARGDLGNQVYTCVAPGYVFAADRTHEIHAPCALENLLE